MYKKTAKFKKYAAMRKAKERIRREAPAPDYPVILPDLRKIIVIIDFDFGKKVNIMRLYKTGRIDQYRVEANGRPWKQRIGLSGVFAGIRKAMPRVQATY